MDREKSHDSMKVVVKKVLENKSLWWREGLTGPENWLRSRSMLEAVCIACTYVEDPKELVRMFRQALVYGIESAVSKELGRRGVFDFDRCAEDAIDLIEESWGSVNNFREEDVDE